MAAILVGFVLTVGSACFCVSLLVFFFTSQLTRWRGREKEKYEDEHKEGVHVCNILCYNLLLSITLILSLLAYSNTVPCILQQTCKQ